MNEIRADSCETICFDLNDHKSENFVIEIKEKFNNLNVLINNASSFFKTDFLTHKDSDWKDLINSNPRVLFYYQSISVRCFQKIMDLLLTFLMQW